MEELDNLDSLPVEQGDPTEEEHHPDPDPTIAPIRLGIVGTVYKGDYNEETDYLDRWQTTYDGSTYIAMKDHPDKPPFPDGENWLITAKGFPEAHYVRFIKGDHEEEWREGEVIISAKDIGLENVTNISLEEILEQVVTGISVNNDPVRQGELNLDIVNKLSINHGEQMVGEVNVDLFDNLIVNGKEVPNESGTGQISLIEGLIINDSEIKQKEFKNNISLTFNGEPLSVQEEEERSVIDLPLNLNQKPIENHNLIAVETITINKKGPQVMLNGNVDLSLVEGVRVNDQILPRVENDLILKLKQNGKDLKLVKSEQEAVIDIEAIRQVHVNGEPVLTQDGIVNLSIKPSSITFTGICESDGAEATKAVSIEEDFEPIKGKRIEVSFLNTNTAANCTLNVNETGAYPIYIKGRPLLVGMARSLQAGGSYSFVFDGEHYLYLSGSTPIHDGRDFTLLESEWQQQEEQEDTFYIATIEVEGLEADDYLSLTLQDNKNLALVKDYKKSGVWAYDQADGSITLACENKPELDWPLHIEITQ